MMKLGGGDGDHGGVSHAASRLGGLLLIVWVLMMGCGAVGLAAEGNSSSSCPEAIFAFGASMTDTGNSQAAFPYASAPQTSLPYGETYFKKPANRYSNGRLVIDFFGTNSLLIQSASLN
jgi:predicted phage tail protein